jgi:hypothetical protein
MRKVSELIIEIILSSNFSLNIFYLMEKKILNNKYVLDDV